MRVIYFCHYPWRKNDAFSCSINALDFQRLEAAVAPAGQHVRARVIYGVLEYLGETI